MKQIYRLLDEGEAIQASDEVWNYIYMEWEPLKGLWVGREYHYSRTTKLGDMKQPIRRRETIEDEPKWVSVDNPPREANKKVLVYLAALGIDVINAGYVINRNTSATHWRELPAPPAKEGDFETFWQTHKDKLVDTNKESIRLIYEEARKL